MINAKSRLITALPQLITLNSAGVKEVCKKLQSMYNANELTRLETYNDIGIICTEGTSTKFSYSLFVENSLVYFVLVVKLKMFNGEVVRQTLVHRLATSAPSAGIVQYILFEKLLSKYSIASDGLQSEHGIRMWQNFIKEAFNRGFKVHLLDTNDKTSIPIPTLAELNNHKIWGSSKWYQRRVLVIEKL